MEQSPASRFVDVLGRLGYTTQQKIADLLQIARPTAGTIVRQERDPSFADVARLKSEHDEVNIDYIFTGKGKPFERTLVPVDAESAHVAAPASVERKTIPPQGDSPLHIVRPTYEELATENAELRRKLTAREGELVDLLSSELKRLRKPKASPEAASLFETMNEIAQEMQGLVYEAPGFKWGIHRKLA